MAYAHLHRYLHVGYLTTYDNMGTAQLTCQDGCRCMPMRLDGYESRKISLTRESAAVAVDFAEGSQPCVIQLLSGRSIHGTRFKVREPLHDPTGP